MNMNKKRLSVVLACFACLLTLIAVTIGSNIYAANGTYDLTVSSGFVPEAEVPLTTKVSTNEFYFNGNINPGDTLEANIKMENTSSNPEHVIKVTISEIKNLLTDDEKAIELLEELELTISTKDKIIYQGPHSDTTAPVIGWEEIAPGQEIIVNIKVHFPKESDNRFQDSPLKVKYIFESQIDIPDEYTEEPPEYSEKVPTGIEGEDAPNYAMFIIGLGACLIVLYIVILIIRAILKKNKKDEKEQKDSTNKTE